MSKIGAHISGFPRVTIEQFCRAKPAAVLGLNDSGVLTEAKNWSDGHTWTFYRTTEVYGERPSDLHNPPGTYAQMANYWYREANPSLKQKYDENKADAYIPDNEPTGGESDNQDEIRQNCKNVVAYERELMKLMNADGKKMGVLALAGGSPGDFRVWVDICVPFIKEAYDAGNYYARHAYEGNWDRVYKEAQYLLDNGLGYGGMIVTEWGFDGGYGQGHDAAKIIAEDETLMAFPNVIGFCLWEYGRTEFNANIDHVVPLIVPYMETHQTEKWQPGSPTPPDEEPPDEEPDTTPWQTAVWEASIVEQRERGITLRRTHGLHAAIVKKPGFVPVTNERAITTGNGDYGYQVAEHFTDEEAARTVLAYKKPWSGTVIELLGPAPPQPPAPPPPSRQTIIDVSRHQNRKTSSGGIAGPLDFSKMKARGAAGCYIRGSIGRTGLDDAFSLNWAAIDKVDMARGMYHLWIATETAEANLANIRNTVQKYGHGNMRIIIDVEPVGGRQINGIEVARFLPLFKSAFGYDPIIYTALWVLPHISGDIRWLSSSLLWLASYWNAPPREGQYPTLPVGASLNNLLGHQWTSSFYDGREWGVASAGLDVSVVYDFNRLLVGDVKPPPAADKIDLKPYVAGDGRRYYLANHNKSTQEILQCQSDGVRFYQVKNQAWESFVIDSSWIRRDKDTSPGGGRYYTQREGTQPARWLPRLMAVGEEFSVSLRVQYYQLSDCSQSAPNSGDVTDTRKLVAHYNKWTSRHSITLQDVIEVQWINGGEKYFYAKGYGLVGWERLHQDSTPQWTSISELVQGGNNSRMSGCFS